MTNGMLAEDVFDIVTSVRLMIFMLVIVAKMSIIGARMYPMLFLFKSITAEITMSGK